MEQRPERRIPTGKELAEGFQEKFERVIRPSIIENERYINRSGRNSSMILSPRTLKRVRTF